MAKVFAQRFGLLNIVNTFLLSIFTHAHSSKLSICHLLLFCKDCTFCYTNTERIITVEEGSLARLWCHGESSTDENLNNISQ